MYKVYQKLKILRAELRVLIRKEYDNVSRQVSNCRDELEKLRSKWIDDHFNVGIQLEEKKKIIHMQKLITFEESFLKQKARCQWVQSSDQNSKFFFRIMQRRKTRNNITQLTLPNGEMSTDQATIKDAILVHNKNFLGTEKTRKGYFDSTVFQNMVVPTEAWDCLCKIVTNIEVKESLWSIKDDKSPWPDGFNSFFFKKTWNIVGKEVILALQDFFSNGEMLKHAKSTIITLIPKVLTPNMITNFRPIACCNVMYKIVSKILAGRLRGVLGGIIHLNQLAFIPWRMICDNIMLAHELLRGYHKEKLGCCALKIDLQKAYDLVACDFLDEVILAFKFPSHFIKLIMNSVRSCMFSVSINGQMEGYFPGKCGLRQGDPISLLLFVLCMEYLTRIFQKITLEWFTFHRDCESLKLCLPCFVDDLFAIAHSDTKSIMIIKNALKHFQEVSGLMTNLQKSVI